MERHEGVIQSPELFFYLPFVPLAAPRFRRCQHIQSLQVFLSTAGPGQQIFHHFCCEAKTRAESAKCHISVKPIWTPQRESVEVELQRSAAEDFNPSAICGEFITGGSKFKIKWNMVIHIKPFFFLSQCVSAVCWIAVANVLQVRINNLKQTLQASHWRRHREIM